VRVLASSDVGARVCRRGSAGRVRRRTWERGSRRRRRRRLRWRRRGRGRRFRNAVRSLHVNVVACVLSHGSLFVKYVVIAVRSLANCSHDRVALCRRAAGLQCLLERIRHEWEVFAIAHIADLDGVETAGRRVWRSRWRRWRRSMRRRCGWRGRGQWTWRWRRREKWRGR
jgi:hypothetical protein